MPMADLRTEEDEKEISVEEKKRKKDGHNIVMCGGEIDAQVDLKHKQPQECKRFGEHFSPEGAGSVRAAEWVWGGARWRRRREVEGGGGQCGSVGVSSLAQWVCGGLETTGMLRCNRVCDKEEREKRCEEEERREHRRPGERWREMVQLSPEKDEECEDEEPFEKKESENTKRHRCSNDGGIVHWRGERGRRSLFLFSLGKCDPNSDG